MVERGDIVLQASDPELDRKIKQHAISSLIRVAVPSDLPIVQAETLLAQLYSNVLAQLGPQTDATIALTCSPDQPRRRQHYNCVILGGTFDHLHLGHKHLLCLAIWTIQPSGRLLLGLTTDEYLSQRSKTMANLILDYAKRDQQLRYFIKQIDPSVDFEILPINDAYGHAGRPDIDAIVVSTETQSSVDDLNSRRIREGVPPLEVVVANTIGLDQTDGAKLSSSWVRTRVDRRQRLESRWNVTMTNLGVDEDLATSQFSRLCSEYEAPGRFYHTLEHLDSMFALFDQISSLHDRCVVEMSIWFHDLIYDVSKTDNEACSAALAISYCLQTGIAELIAKSSLIDKFILATTSHETDLASLNEASLSDLRSFLDIDLSILGKPAEEYIAYAKNIAREYRDVYSTKNFCQGRCRILQRILSKQRIFKSDEMFNRFEQQARANLALEIRSLSTGCLLNQNDKC